MLRKRQRWDRSWLRLCFCRSHHSENGRDGTVHGNASVFVDLIIIVSKLIQNSWWLLKPVLLEKSRDGTVHGYASVFVDLII